MNSLPDVNQAGTSTPTRAVASHWSVRTLLIWLVLACLLPGILGAVALFFYEYREGRAQLEKDTIQTARALVQAVDNQILQAQALAEGLASADSLAEGELAKFHEQARRTLAESHLGITVVLADRLGQQILNAAENFGASLPPYGAADIANRVFETGEPAVSNLYRGRVLKRPLIAVAVPVTQEGKVIYALAISVLPERFNGILSTQGLPPGWVATILDGKGTIVARSRAAEEYVGQKPADAFLRQFMESDEGVMEATMKDGVPVISAYSRSAVTNWRVAISIPRDSLSDQLVRRLFLLALGVSALFAIGIGLAWLMGGRIAGSFRGLVRPAAAVGAGEKFVAPPATVREADELAKAMARAADLLQERTARLQDINRSLIEKERELNEAHSLAKFGSWHWDLQTAEVIASDSIRELCGRDIPPFAEQRGTLLTVESWERAAEAVRHVAETGGFDLDVEVNHGSGGTLWINAKGAAIRDAAGRVVALRGTVLDITDRKRAETEIQRLNAELEQQVQERTAELRRANDALLHTNAELQHFAHATAHDLQTPLRSIAGFTHLVQQEVHGRVDRRVDEWSALVIDNTKRLQDLIQALLTYTRLDVLGRPFERVDARKVFDEVAASLAVLIGETGAEVSCGELPTVAADRTQLAQVLQKLVENGIKYNKSEPPRVTVDCSRQEDDWVFSVADNGIGIDPRHHERIFEIFRRLHSYSQVPGTGIGLALCRRIVERHGGRMWVESAPGQGSVFYFSLPVSTDVAATPTAG
ncbi:MAG TPA: ATP-binding protein [Rhodocyclaceae bacterium]|nr:ATP-binding protein [Rhodocyclaceae bacterium]